VEHHHQGFLGFKYSFFIFTLKIGEVSHFDDHIFSDGLVETTKQFWFQTVKEFQLPWHAYWSVSGAPKPAKTHSFSSCIR